MQMIRWRKHNKLSLRRAAELCGLKSAGTLSRIERGILWVSPETIDAIYWLTWTVGPEPVTAQDHIEAWRAANRETSLGIKQDSTAAGKVHKKTLNGRKAKPRKVVRLRQPAAAPEQPQGE